MNKLFYIFLASFCLSKSFTMNLIHEVKNNNYKNALHLLLLGVDKSAKDERNGRTALHWSLFLGHKEMFKLLMSFGTDINLQDNIGFTPLHWAIDKAPELQYDIEIVRRLINNNVINIVDNYDCTPLDRATHNNKFKDIVKLLIYNGAFVNRTNKNNWTALHYATLNHSTEIVKILLYNDADVTIVNNLGKTAFNIAIEKNYQDLVDLIMPYTIMVGTLNLAIK